MREIPHHLAAMLGHVGAILTEPQGVIDGSLHGLRMRKKVLRSPLPMAKSGAVV
jgi:hypothetical protein